MTVEAPEWTSSLTDESLKTNPSLQSFKSVDDLAKSYIETKQMVGKKGMILNDGESETDFRGPKSPDEYKMPQVQLKEGMALNEDQLKEFRAYAHKVGIPQRHFEKILEYRFGQQMRDLEASDKAQREAKEKGETAMRQEWGAKYDENIANFKKVVKALGEGLELPDDPNSYDARIVRLISRMSSHFAEGTIGDLGIQKGGSITPDEAKAQIAKVRGDDKHPYNIANHPEHKKAVEEVNKLYGLAFPGKKII